jgi:hypothetical protein
MRLRYAVQKNQSINFKDRTVGEDRVARLKKALKSNIARRKTQMTARNDQAEQALKTPDEPPITTDLHKDATKHADSV